VLFRSPQNPKTPLHPLNQLNKKINVVETTSVSCPRDETAHI